MLNRKALGYCHHGLGLEPWGKGRRCWRRNELLYWASQFGWGSVVLRMKPERRLTFLSLVQVCFCQHSSALIHYQWVSRFLPYIETVSENKNSLWRRMTQVFGSGIREHFTFRSERLRAPEAKTAVWFSSLASSSSCIVCSSKHTTVPTTNHSLKLTLGPSLKSPKLPLGTGCVFVCVCERELHKPLQPMLCSFTHLT